MPNSATSHAPSPGQKIWTSGAHFADYGITVTRSDPKAPKHVGDVRGPDFDEILHLARTIELRPRWVRGSRPATRSMRATG